MTQETSSVIRCTRCRGLLEQSGKEVYRHVCPQCGTNYMMVLQLVEIPPADPSNLLPEKTSAE